MKINKAKNEKTEDDEIEISSNSTLDAVSITGSVLRIKIYQARADEEGFSAIDFSGFFLPPVPFTGRVISFQERPELMLSIVNAIRGYVGRVSESKSTHIIAGEMVRTLVKFIEFGWLNGCYSLEDFAPSVTARFAQDIAEGGWAKALQLDKRMRDLIEQLPTGLARNYVNSPTSKYPPTIKRTLWQALGTNMNVASPLGRELLFRAAGYIEPGNRKRLWKQTAVHGTEASRLSIILATVNLLADDAENPSLHWVPFPNCSDLSDTLGRPGSRTPSLNPDHVARWLKESLRYVQ
ncbi:hypothetical protein J2W35_006426 [Variovorax boronicumulans]|uniref:hypothetical protein n=1 Tax=Variovorax boronicumulans TaxID=436515 RepID=UPI002786EF79|nr:hypothetical protein [Variovorax boronicumulans]MDQ0086045.1 hypothetical protein [Variovorax boronicumulans]